MSDELLTNFETAHKAWRDAKLDLADAEYNLKLEEAKAVYNAGDLGKADARKYAIVIAIDNSPHVKVQMANVRSARGAYYMADGALEATIHALKNYRAQLRHEK
jgi:hypothetical protein